MSVAHYEHLYKLGRIRRSTLMSAVDMISLHVREESWGRVRVSLDKKRDH